jgi:succinate-acetate transporter protein
MAHTGLAWMLSTGIGVRAHGGQNPVLAWMFIVVAAATCGCLASALAESKALVTVLAFLIAGSMASGIGLLAGTERWLVLAEYLFAMAALAAWYTASALVLNQTRGREVLSVGRRAHAHEMPAVTMARREPDVMRDRAA